MMMKHYFCVLLCFCAASLEAAGFQCEKWEVTHYVSDSAIISLCDKGVVQSPIQFFENEYSQQFNEAAYRNIESGDIVWIQCRFLGQFFEKTLPITVNPFVLVVNDGDESFPSNSGLTGEQLHLLLADPRVIHIFAQNCDLKESHPKITLLPIGVDYHTIGYKGVNGGWGEVGSPKQQEARLNEYLKSFRPTHLRRKQAFVDFQFSDSIRYGEQKRYLQLGEDRTTIFHRLLPTGLITYGTWMRRSALWATKGQYAFSISPHGNGLDCHRTWEDLVLGCIVIVKTSTLDPLYKGLPVVIVQDWSEVTSENMSRWMHQYADAFTNPSYREKLTHKYWMDQIYAAALPHKKKV